MSVKRSSSTEEWIVEYWRFIDRVAAEVDQWPAWKRGESIGGRR